MPVGQRDENARWAGDEEERKGGSAREPEDEADALAVRQAAETGPDGGRCVYDG